MTAFSSFKPSQLSEVQSMVFEWERKQYSKDEIIRQQEIAKRKEEEEAMQRVSRLRANCSLEEWKDLTDEERQALLIPNESSTCGFNEQKNASIEWAHFSWNPVTGCRHGCPYCYARDIATQAKMARSYPNGFEPTFRSDSLIAPRRVKVPKEAATDTRYRNVFTCSMADLFGKWVPEEWINAVLTAARDNPQWNFLFLTKFPNRMAEFDIPANAWMGTSVDMQARVATAEKAFEKIQCGVRWLSVEPMIEPLTFTRLDLFDWVVLGGASESSQTPKWRPPFPWIADLVHQCREAGTRVYFKDNLLGNRITELPFDAPIQTDLTVAPEVFHYLKGTQK
ncbi:hypothetical protein CCP4SC76_5650005 [Gammaproteobacteria bacterium]